MSPDAAPEPPRENPPEIIRRGESEVLAGATISLSHRSGPLPPAEDLAAYDDRFPGFGERILILAEKRVLHDMEVEKAQIELELEIYHSDQKRSYQGMWLGGTIILTAIGGGITAIVQNHDTAGAAVIASVVGALAYVFSTTLNQRREERESQQKQAKEKTGD